MKKSEGLVVKPNYILIPLIGVLVPLLGELFTEGGMKWYSALTKPAGVPPSWVFSFVWAAIFFMTSWAALLIWNNFKRDKIFWTIIALLSVNAILNFSWCYVFFRAQMFCLSFYIVLALILSLVFIMLLSYKRSKTVVLLLLPYLLWISVASFWNYSFWKINLKPSFWSFGWLRK
ncbi:MAG: hypothetical protein UR26_C0001G0043 [candidate division TM6 bacterium GW2011_GWF2_32_72]|nr:MAG: hypothetical protein UR26_C0001G0043 [candidate division TM6 bacterium GW2011_GWF2_32_72]